MNKKEFNLYSEVLLNIFNNNFNDIENVIEEIKKIIPSIRIYIYEFNSNIKSNSKEFSQESIYSIKNLLFTLKNNENINSDYDDTYIKENYEYHYNILKSKGIENFIVYPFNIIDEFYGYIYICIDDSIDKINYTIELIANLLIKNIERIYSNNNEIITLYNEIKEGIMLNEFKFVYQPKFNIKSNQIIGA